MESKIEKEGEEDIQNKMNEGQDNDENLDENNNEDSSKNNNSNNKSESSNKSEEEGKHLYKPKMNFLKIN